MIVRGQPLYPFMDWNRPLSAYVNCLGLNLINIIFFLVSVKLSEFIKGRRITNSKIETPKGKKSSKKAKKVKSK